MAQSNKEFNKRINEIRNKLNDNNMIQMQQFQNFNNEPTVTSYLNEYGNLTYSVSSFDGKKRKIYVTSRGENMGKVGEIIENIKNEFRNDYLEMESNYYNLDTIIETGKTYDYSTKPIEKKTDYYSNPIVNNLSDIKPIEKRNYVKQIIYEDIKEDITSKNKSFFKSIFK